MKEMAKEKEKGSLNPFLPEIPNSSLFARTLETTKRK